MEIEHDVNDVEIGWIIFLDGGETAYVSGLKPDKVQIRRKHPSGEKWMTHWLTRSSFATKFIEKYGETAICINCGFVPTESDRISVTCPRCHYVDFSWSNDDE